MSRYERHHIVAQNSTQAIEARAILDDVKVPVEADINKVDISYGFHKHLHNKLYYTGVNAYISTAYTIGKKRGMEKEAVLVALGTLKAGLKVVDETLQTLFE